MIARLTGTIVEQNEKGIILEVGGIGYLVFTPFMGEIFQTTTLYTHLVIREDSQELYGFETSDEKNLFTILINVSGVGPKTALQMISLYPLTEIVSIIKNSDSKSLSLVPGIGKKTAEKIVIDLKDKLDKFVHTTSQGPKSDLVEALISLGYKDVQIKNVISEVDHTLSIEKQIRDALSKLQKK